MEEGYQRAKNPADFAPKHIRSAYGVGLRGSEFWVVMNMLGGGEELEVVMPLTYSPVPSSAAYGCRSRLLK